MAEYNNPGNIRPGQKYAGETGKFYAARDGSKYVIFDSKEMGLRALFIDLKSKINQFDGDVEKIISKYAPSSDANPTKNYIDFVKSNVGKDIVTEQDLPKLVSAVIKFENKPKTASKYLKPDLLQTAMQLSSVNMPQKTTLAEAKEIVGIESKAPKQQNTSNEQETILSTVRPATDARAKRVQKLIDASEEPLNIIEERQQSNIPTKQIADKTLNIIETRQKSDGSIDDSDSVAILEQRQNVVASQPDETELSLLERQTKPIERQAKPIEKNVNGFLYGKPDPLNFLPNQAIDKPLGTFTENITAAYRASRATDQSVSEGTMLRDEWQPIIDEINEKTGSKYFNPADHLRAGLFSAPATQGDGERKYQYSTQKIFKHIQDNSDVLPDLQTITHEQLLKQAQQQALANRENFGEVTHRSTGASNVIARFLGSMGGIATDPVVYESMGFAGASKTLYGAMFREAAIGAGTEAVAQAGVKQWYESLGLDYTYEQFWTAVAFGGVFGAGTPLAFRVAGKSVSLTADQAKKGYQALVGSGAARETGTTRAARATAEAADDAVAANPLGPKPEAKKDFVDQALDAAKEAKEELSAALKAKDAAAAKIDDDLDAGKITLEQAKQLESELPEFIAFKKAQEKFKELDEAANKAVADDAKGIVPEQIIPSRQDAEIAHDARVMDADRAVENNVPPSMPDAPPVGVRPPESAYDADNLDGLVFRFDPDEIGVDAETFQFKAGGDEFGVTERLQGITTWDAIKAGQISVFEFADGRRFIADGHQRLGLAKRIKAQDPSQDVRLYGHLLREVDGITPEMARVIAAVKNVAEGTGTAIDAAKVLRDAPERFGELPPKSALVRQAQGLVNLTDDAFGVVINGVVPANYAALVGRLIPDDEGLQANALSVLSKTDPANEFQAESIVRQVRDAGSEKVTQIGLFGEEVITESFFAERARILDRAQRILRQDKNAFKSLVDNASRLEAEGNQLAKQANQRRADNDTQAIALLQALANRKGDLSDALTAAAREARETGSYTEPSRGFVDAIRRSIESGDFDRISTGDVGQPVNVAAESRIAAKEPEPAVDEFDQPGGVGAQRQADQLEADNLPPRREAMQEDEQLRDDLRQLLERGADETEIDSHPAVTRAIEEAKAIPETHTLDGYLSERWIETREFKFGEETVTGFADAVQRLYEGARRLAWTDEGKVVPDAPTRFEKRAVVVLGPPAAGKSTIANPVARKLGAVVIDADEAKKVLPEYNNGIGANAVHEESSYISNLVEQITIAQGANIVIPKVGGSPDSIRRLITRLRDAGYEIDIMDMAVKYGEARRRMYLRFVNTGRLIDPDYVRAVGDNPSKTYDTLKQEGVADGYTRIDNNVGRDAEKPILEDTRNLLEGTDLRVSEGRGQSGELGARAVSEEPSTGRIGETESELELDLEIPVAERIGDDGEVIAETMTLRDIRNEIDQDQKMLDRLEGCAA